VVSYGSQAFCALISAVSDHLLLLAMVAAGCLARSGDDGVQAQGCCLVLLLHHYQPAFAVGPVMGVVCMLVPHVQPLILLFFLVLSFYASHSLQHSRHSSSSSSRRWVWQAAC
jgi:hypothetical protein